MGKTTLDKVKIGERFRFSYESVDIIRTASQIGKTEIYCPHQNSDPYNPESEVYLRDPNSEVIILNSDTNKIYSDFEYPEFDANGYSCDVICHADDGKLYIGWYDFDSKKWQFRENEGPECNFVWMYMPKEFLKPKS